jgi:hypothetical protein
MDRKAVIVHHFQFSGWSLLNGFEWDLSFTILGKAQI